MTLGERQNEPVVARAFVENRKAAQLRHRRRRLARPQPAAALRHEKRLRVSNQNSDGARPGSAPSPAMTWSATSFCSSGRNQAAASEASTTSGHQNRRPSSRQAMSSSGVVLARMTPGGFHLGDERGKIFRLGDAGQPRDRLMAPGDDDFFAGLDLGEELGEPGFGFADFDGERHRGPWGVFLAAKSGPAAPPI